MKAAMERALKVLKVKEDELQEFDVEDPFNDQTRIRGYICRRADHRYGALYITHVDKFKAEQLIYAVPKFGYPFDRNGVFKFPPARELEAYEKFDGTSIFGFRYWGGGEWRTTFKLRLGPVVRNSRFGPFLDMWREILERYPDLTALVDNYTQKRGGKLVDDRNYGLAFELYGRRNKHLIIYEEDLEVALLFGVAHHGNGPTVVPASALDRGSVPIPDYVASGATEGLESRYKASQAMMEGELTEDETLEGFRGVEGQMWYLFGTDMLWRPFKAKPETIETIHWASGGIPSQVILATAHNVLETHDEVDEDELVRLLKEDYDENQIEAARARLTKAVAAVNTQVRFRREVFGVYDAIDFDIDTQRSETMRALSTHFPKSDMQRVYSVLTKTQ